MIIAVTSQASTCTHHRIDKRPHLLLAAGESHQRHHGERQLQAENHLAEDQQLVNAFFADQQNHGHGGN